MEALVGLTDFLAPPDEVRRFWDKVQLADSRDGCWVWTGAQDQRGSYGRFRTKGGRLGSTTPAHRYIYDLFYGPIPVGYEVDHLCHNRPCVNIFHLKAVPPEQNKPTGLYSKNGKKTHCPSGHPYNEENTQPLPSKADARWRKCRTCGRERARQYRQRRLVPSR